MVSQILRVSIHGQMPNGEVWSVNPCWEIDGITGSLVTAAECQTIADAIVLLSPGGILAQATAATTTIVGARVEARRLTGELEANAEQIKATPLVGTGTSVHPYQSSIVISLKTPGVGPSARGRLYWPATGIALDTSTYRLSTTNRDGILSAAKTYLSAIETAIQATLPNANLTVWSRKTANFHNVNALQVGNVIDTQRRRRDTLIESYASVSFP